MQPRLRLACALLATLALMGLSWSPVGAGPRDHYFIVHRLLPELLFSQTEKTLAALSTDPEGFLRERWRERWRARGKAPEAEKAREAAQISAQLFEAKGKKLLVVTWPPPQDSPEAYCSILVLADPPSYFTLEMTPPETLAPDADAQKTSAALGRWEGKTHAFLGLVALPQSKQAVVDVLLANGRIE